MVILIYFKDYLCWELIFYKLEKNRNSLIANLYPTVLVLSRKYAIKLFFNLLTTLT